MKLRKIFSFCAIFYFGFLGNVFSDIHESYSGETENEDYSACRWATNFDWFVYKKMIQLFHWNEVFMSAEDLEDLWLRARTGLHFPLYKGFSWTVQHNWDWDNMPAEGQRRSDSALLFTLGYQVER